MDIPMYLLPFKRQYGDYDFSLIYNSLKQFYPIGRTQKRLTDQTISSFKGFKKRGDIIESEFMGEGSYEAKWGKLTAHLRDVFKVPVHGHASLNNGGFFGEVITLEDKQPDFVREKSLKFYVSNIGPFFSIHGVDKSNAILLMDPDHTEYNEGNFEATHALTLSPIFEYAEVFRTLEKELRTYFPGHLFVPYDVGMSTLKYISVADDLVDPRIIDTIYEGIYGKWAVYSCLTRGDRKYGLADWVKPITRKEKSLINLISEHIVNAPGEITINKVWKLQYSRRREAFHSGSSVLEIDLFDLIDFTDKATVIMMRQNDRTSASKTTYLITDNIIKFQGDLSLEIISLTDDTLTPQLLVDFPGFPERETIEMKLVQMKEPLS
jgi:hypothetical protein